jgi:GWxTD domain-containing protein
MFTRKAIIKAYLLATAALWCSYGFAQNPEKDNLSYLYNTEAPVQCISRVAVSKAEATIFLQVTLAPEVTSGVNIRYREMAAYDKEEVLQEGELTDSEHLIKKEGNHQYYKFTVPLTQATAFVFVYIKHDAYTLRFDVPIVTEQDFPPTDLLVMHPDEDIPYFNDYIEADQPFRVVSWYGADTTQAFVYYYGHDFAPNAPPMSTSTSSADKSLQIDTLVSIPLNEETNRTDPGLYFVQTDTTSLSGISFRIVSPYYPRFVKAPQLIDPLIYISTSQEIGEMEDSEDPKKALDNYWLKVTRSRERAKEVIREYYHQVTEANALYTTYKEGWKTGQGMVYVLYGAPDEVYRAADRETWIYSEERNLIEIQFVFAKVKNIFTQKHYELIPDSDYGKFWYRNIDLWRKGRKEI